jgi:hypothetical protein
MPCAYTGRDGRPRRHSALLAAACLLIAICGAAAVDRQHASRTLAAGKSSQRALAQAAASPSPSQQ